MEYYSSIKKNEILTHMTTHINLKNIKYKTPHTGSHILYDSMCIKMSRTGKTTATESGVVAARKRAGATAEGFGVSF